MGAWHQLVMNSSGDPYSAWQFVFLNYLETVQIPWMNHKQKFKGRNGHKRDFKLCYREIEQLSLLLLTPTTNGSRSALNYRRSLYTLGMTRSTVPLCISDELIDEPFISVMTWLTFPLYITDDVIGEPFMNQWRYDLRGPYESVMTQSTSPLYQWWHDRQALWSNPRE